MDTFTVEAIVLDTQNFGGNVTLHPAYALKRRENLGVITAFEGRR